jgi:glycosyltransferase involved in cell wall biosynthesis
MTKVTLFVASMKGGGAERVIANLSQGFAQLHIPTDMLLVWKTGDYLRFIPPEVPVISLEVRRLWQCHKPLVRYLRETRPDAMLSTLTRCNFHALLAKRFAKVPTRLVVREANTPSVEEQVLGFYERTVLRIMKRFYKHADRIVAVSKGVADDLARFARLPRERISVVYNPTINADLYAMRDQPVDHPWLQAGELPVVLGVGRLAPQKGFDVLLKAFAQAREQVQARLIILGEGPNRVELEQLAGQLGVGKEVDMPGFVQNPFAYMRRAGVFVLASRFEGLPNTLIQAMGCECPVVSTDCPSGPEEVLDGGRYGAIVPVDDVEAMAKAIVSVLQGDVPKVPDEWLNRFRLEYVVKYYLDVLGITPPLGV